MNIWMPKALFWVIFVVLLSTIVCSTIADKQELLRMRSKNFQRNLMKNLANKRTNRPSFSVQESLKSADENFIDRKSVSDSKSNTENKKVLSDLENKNVNKNSDNTHPSEDLTYFVNEPVRAVPVALHESQMINYTPRVGATAYVEPAKVYTQPVSVPHTVHAPVMASPHATPHVTPHVVPISAPPPIIEHVPSSNETFTVEEVKEIVHEELAHNLKCHPEEPTYLHDVNLNLCPWGEQAVAAPLMFAEKADELKERGGFPWWLLALILLGLFLIGKIYHKILKLS